MLKRGEKLDRMQTMSSNLRAESRKFEKHSKYINYQAMLRTWAPVASIVVVVLIVMYFRFRG